MVFFRGSLKRDPALNQNPDLETAYGTLFDIIINFSMPEGGFSVNELIVSPPSV